MRAMIIGCLCGFALIPLISQWARSQECDRQAKNCVAWACQKGAGTITIADPCAPFGAVTYDQNSCVVVNTEESMIPPAPPGTWTKNRRVMPLRDLCPTAFEAQTLQCGNLMVHEVGAPAGCNKLVGSCSGLHVEPC